MTTTPPSGIALSLRRRSRDCQPPFQACGMTSDACGVVALDAVEFEVDAGRDDEAVVGEAPAAVEAHGPLCRVDLLGGLVGDMDAELLEPVVVVGDAREGAKAADVVVREEAARVELLGLDERHVERRIVAASGGPATVAPPGRRR